MMGSVHRSGGRIACGSDWFVSSLNPLDAIEVGIRRQDPHLPEGSPQLNPQETVDLATMIAGYTINGAYLMHQDDIVGSIETGKRADLIVLDRNLFDIPPAEINQAKVLLTLFDGRVVYDEGVCSA
ncbi:MAG: amidohydrolase family protein [Deltaproteobacteria bacterium]|nr:amidohydrolase family protein [Deltaproteobacteria bacterium]